MAGALSIAVSPYHLTTREAPALASLLLADHVFTLRPGDTSGPAACAIRSSASYRELLRSWAWSEDLWREGIIRSDISGEAATDDVRRVHESITEDDRFAPLRTFLHLGMLDHERLYLEALAADVVKGGPDPGISVPIIAGLDRFAGRHGLTAARAHPTSVAEKSEWTLAANRLAFGIPVFLQADAQRLLHARDVLEDVLAPLREALAARSTLTALSTPHDEAVTLAAERYAAAFDDRREDLFDGTATDEVRAIDGPVTVSSFHLPADAVLTSSLHALHTLAPVPDRRAATASPAAGLLRTTSGPVAALAFKALGRR